MSEFTDAFLFYGLFASAITAPSPYDVRAGVDTGDGDLGTLTSPAIGDVRQGVSYGGGGTQYTGTLFAPALPSSNRFVTAWDRLYEQQTYALGEAILATVQGYAVSKRAVIGSRDLDSIFVEGGVSEGGEITIQMKAGDFSALPDKDAKATCNGSLIGKTFEIIATPENNNGILYLTLGFFAAKNK